MQIDINRNMMDLGDCDPGDVIDEGGDALLVTDSIKEGSNQSMVVDLRTGAVEWMDNDESVELFEVKVVRI